MPLTQCPVSDIIHKALCFISNTIHKTLCCVSHNTYKALCAASDSFHQRSALPSVLGLRVGGLQMVVSCLDSGVILKLSRKGQPPTVLQSLCCTHVLHVLCCIHCAACIVLHPLCFNHCAAPTVLRAFLSSGWCCRGHQNSGQYSRRQDGVFNGAGAAVAVYH